MEKEVKIGIKLIDTISNTLEEFGNVYKIWNPAIDKLAKITLLIPDIRKHIKVEVNSTPTGKIIFNEELGKLMQERDAKFIFQLDDRIDDFATYKKSYEIGGKPVSKVEFRKYLELTARQFANLGDNLVYYTAQDLDDYFADIYCANANIEIPREVGSFTEDGQYIPPEENLIS